MTNEQISQYGECIILDALYKNKIGYFVDIGAADGELYSNTLKLTRYGWKGILVEPCQHFLSKLEKLHEGNDRVNIYQGAVTNKNGTSLLHVWNTADESQISTVNEEQYKSIDNDEYWKDKGKFTDHYEVQTCTPSILLETYTAPKQIDFVDIDAEGSEMQILEAWPWTEYDVQLFCVETTPGVDVLLQYFGAKNYLPLVKTGGNIMFVKAEDQEKLQKILKETFG
jgi:FkbM family methyltransferase